MNLPLRTLVAEDEPLARKRLASLVMEFDQLQLVAEATSGLEALESIKKNRPDVVLLDIHMPYMLGTEVAAKIPSDMAIHIIFVTAYDDYAIKAFELNAIDYLLKPFDRSRFETTVERILKKEKTELAKVQRFIESADKKQPDAKLLFKTSDGIKAIWPLDILWAESAGNYVKICTESDAFIARQTMSDFQSRLDENIFVRIHRSHVINLSAVKSLSALKKGDYEVSLIDGVTLRLSRHYKQRFFELFSVKEQ